MRVFVYEFVTGGGFLGEDALPPRSLLQEGGAMVACLAADFAAIDGVEVTTLRDRRLKSAGATCGCPGLKSQLVGSAEEEMSAFDELASEADWTVVIAPETESHLLHRCRRVEAVGGRLLGLSPALVELASNKSAMAAHLQAAGVPVPKGVSVEPGQACLPEIRFPAVGKPRLGAGSEGVRFLPDRASAMKWLSGIRVPSRLEEFHPGMAASVAFLCGPAGQVPLLPCRQRLHVESHFHYEGGSLPLPCPFDRRALGIAQRAVAVLPEPLGYLGVDLVLGDRLNGTEDVVVEVNPRLTTSYVGLRAAVAAGGNLAAAMLEVAAGLSPRLPFRPVRLEFDPLGTVREACLNENEQTRE